MYIFEMVGAMHEGFQYVVNADGGSGAYEMVWLGPSGSIVLVWGAAVGVCAIVS